MFKKDSYIIYKGDVCKVKDIIENYYDETDYYVLMPLKDESMTIKIPINNESIKNIVSKEEAINIIKSFKSTELIDLSNEKNAEHVYIDLLNDSTHKSLVKIIKTTYVRNQARINNNKKISEKDDNYFRKAEKRLYEELAVSLDKSVDEIRSEIIECCK